MDQQEISSNQEILLVSHEMTCTGAPRSLLNMALVLRELGYRPCVWTLRPGNLQQEYDREGFPVTVVPFPEEASERLAGRIGKYRLVIANTVFCGAFAGYASRYAETVLYLREAGNLPQIVSGCGLNTADLTKAVHLVCVSEYAKECIQRMYPVRVEAVILNYVEDWRKKAEAEVRHRRRKTAGGGAASGNGWKRGGKLVVRFLVSGTLEPRKGQDTALEAFRNLPPELRERAELHLAGQMPVWAASYQESLGLDAGGRIYYHGEISGRDKLLRFYQEMDVVLVTSRDEACSLVALEAAMLGKALVVTENTGAKYLVSPSCILPAGDAAALRGKMAEYIERPSEIPEEGKENRARYLVHGTKELYRESLGRYMRRIGAGGRRAGGAEEGSIRVSVIVPVYNVEKYLRECLDSLLAQTLPGLEILCVDDGSTDGCAGILREYLEGRRGGQGKQTLRVITTENHGYGHAVNIGMEAAGGEYIGIAEPDDYVDSRMYEKLYHLALAADAEIVKCDFCRFTGEGAARRDIYQRTAREMSNYYRVICPGQEKDSFRYIMNTWCGIYRRDFLFQNGIRHNESPGASYQDNGFWFQGFCYAERVIFLPEALYYNRRDNAASSVNQRGKVYCANEEYAFIRRFLAGHPRLEKEFLNQYSLKKYHTCLFTLDRIAWEYKREYLCRTAEEFRKAESAGELSKAVFTPQEWGNLQWMMRDPEGYYARKVAGEIQISVIIPVCNMEKYIVQCLESLERQTFGRYEALCIDDGSTDASAALVEEFAGRDRRFLLYRQANAGAGAARNAGLRMARGEYVIFLDADDFFAPDMLLHAWRKIRETESDICVIGSWQYDDRTGETVPCTYSLQPQHYPAHRPFRVSQMSYNPFRAFVGWAWDKLYRREFLLNHGLLFQEQRTSNDMYFTYMSLFKADRITTLEERLIWQRRNVAGSLSATRDRSWHCFYSALCAMRLELEEMGLYGKNRVYFENYAVHSCLWNLMTLPEEAALKLLDQLRGGWLEELGVSDFGERDAEYPAEYKAYRKIVEEGAKGLMECRAGERERQLKPRGGSWEGQPKPRGGACIRRQDSLHKTTGQREKGQGQEKMCQDFQDEAAYYRYCLEEIRRSKSYKIGLAITWLARKLREMASKGTNSERGQDTGVLYRKK